jgi:hypothetical protein
MSYNAIATVIKMMESVSEPLQNQIVEHLRDYLEDLKDEIEWDTLVAKTQPQLVEAAKRVRDEIRAGKAKPMDYNQL